MKKSPARSQQNNTLLNYFSRTPKQETQKNYNDYNKIDNVDMIENEKNQSPFQKVSKKKISSNGSGASPVMARKNYEIYSLVWAKLEGYPWWPSIICNDPETENYEHHGKIHVQFFDDPISHAWILKRDIKPYDSSPSILLLEKSSDPRLKSAIKAAEDAMNMTLQERCNLIGPLNSDDYEVVSDYDDHKNTPSKRKTDQMNITDDDDEDEIKNKSSNNKRFKRLSFYFNEEDEDEYCPDQSEFDESSDQDSIEDVNEDESDEEIENWRKQSKNTKSNMKKINKKKKDKLDNFIVDDDETFEEELEKSDTLKIKDELNISENDEIRFKFVQVDHPIHENNDVSEDFDQEKKNQSTCLQYAILENKNFVTKIPSNSKNIVKPTAAEEATKTQWPHLSYKFLLPENIKDIDGNKMLINGELNSHYDPSTLYVPLDFLDQQTPAMRQWWELKSKHFDTILFFKMGKFYEFFHMDAVVCTKELKILFMRGENAHAGFPEKSYKQYADALIQKGYKVARVEQTETPDMMIERCKTLRKPSKFDRVVKREICRISSLGTRYMSDIDSDTFLDYTSYLMAFTCKPIEKSLFEFGISFVDISLGKFFLAQFRDDRFYSKLRTLVSHYSPVEIIMENSNKLSKLIPVMCSNARIQQVKRFWPSNKTLKYIYEKDFWSKTSEDFRKSILDPSDVIQQTSRTEFELAVTSLGAIIEYLEKSLIIEDIMTMGQFEIYYPPKYDSTTTKLPNHMILDSMAMKNLEVFEPLGDNRSKTSTLFKIIDHCATAFGKRMLHCWMCQPLCGLREDLELRREAVLELAENDAITPYIKKWNNIMKKIPDLDRLLTQIHSQSLLKRAKDHPDARAILFESDTYKMRRIKTFLDALSGFEGILEIIEDVSSKLDNLKIKSRYLHKLTTFENLDGFFPQIKDKITFFRKSFDAEKVRKENNFIPDKGVDEEYDQAIEKIDEMDKKFNDYLKKQELFFKTRINYVHANKNRYTLEIPDSCDSKVNNSDENYEFKSSRKGFKRYYTQKLIEMVEELEEAENQRENILNDIFRRLLSKFDKDYTMWRQAIACLAQFDALISLANTRQIFESNGSVSCLPQFLWNSEEPLISVKDLRNAFLVINRSVIPNDIDLKGETLILTGPNMGGKTTLMRSVGLMIILAQIGAYVPASECQLSPVDRIFTRIGAYDLLMENESTFMVEMSEALAIVKYSSSMSLALIDELGSGTSTFDGTAIASAIISNLTEEIKCRTIFSTHYHSILDELKDKANVKLGFMSYMIENENDQNPVDENVIFLYKLQSGICNKSYGFNVAKLGGLPVEVIRQGYKHSKQFDLECQIKSLLNWFRLRKQSNIIKIDDETRKKGIELQNKIIDLKKLRENNP